MSAYHDLSAVAKREHALERMRELGVRCPVCETETPVPELLVHLRERCTGPRTPHPAARWLGWPEAHALGVTAATLSRLVASGVVRMRHAQKRGAGRRYEYLARDLVLALAWRWRLSRAPARPRRPPPRARVGSSAAPADAGAGRP